MQVLWLDGDTVDIRWELIGRTEQYGAARGSMLLLTLPKSSEVCSENSDCHMRTDRLACGYVEHSNDVKRNQSASTCH